MLTGRSAEVNLVTPAIIYRQTVSHPHVHTLQGKIGQHGMPHLCPLKHNYVLAVDLQFHLLIPC